jgi:hypothetical protein
MKTVTGSRVYNADILTLLAQEPIPTITSDAQIRGRCLQLALFSGRSRIQSGVRMPAGRELSSAQYTRGVVAL